MDEVSFNTSWERSDHEVFLFEQTKGSFNLWSHVEEKNLPSCCNFLPLGMMRWSYDNGFVAFPEPSSHDTAPIVAVTDEYSGLSIDELLHVLVVVLIGWSED